MNVNFSVSTSYSLLERSIAGDSDAWTCLSDLYAPMIYRWIRKCGVQRSDANDLTQKTFVKVFQNLGNFGFGQGRFRGWLWMIARNQVRDFVDEQKSRHDPTDHIELDKIELKPWDAVDSDVPPREIVERALAHLQHHLDARTRLIVSQVVMAGRSAIDVADELGITPNAVYIAKSRGIKKLKQLLADVEYPNAAGDE